MFERADRGAELRTARGVSRSGGNAEIVGEAGVPFSSADEVPAALDRIAADLAAWQSRIAVPALASIADRYLDAMGLTHVPEAA